jgi:solute:Na+ symporter, SSS family
MYLTKGWQMPFMMQAWWLFVICTCIYFMVSYATPEPPAQVTGNYTWDHPLAFLKGKITRFSDVRVVAIFLFVLLIVLYTFFS